jgi:hypothetical protein
MRYVLTTTDKRRQTSIVRQLWRLAVLSRRFMKLTRQGSCKPFDRGDRSTPAS